MQKDKSIQLTAVAECSLETAWKKWTTHEGLLTFFGADNQMKLEIDGPFEIYFLMDAPAGFRGSEGCKILNFEPFTVLSFSWNVPPQFEVLRKSGFKNQVIINFNYIDHYKTSIELNHIGWPEGDDYDAVFNYFENAWKYVLSRFVECCKMH